MYLDVGGSTRLRFDPDDGPFPYPDDGYPAVIADAATAYKAQTVAQVTLHWVEKLGHAPTPDLRAVVPYINRGRWLADCPQCSAGFYVWDQMPNGCCLRCGLVFKVLWQPPKVRSEAIRLLAVRLCEQRNCVDLFHPMCPRNWDAHKGETLERLAFENRWHLGDVTVEKNGVKMPSALVLPDSLTAKSERFA